MANETPKNFGRSRRAELPPEGKGASTSPCRGLDTVSLLYWQLSLLTLLHNSRSGEGHDAEAHRVMGARAVPAGGFAACSRAAWASCLPALRPGWEVHPWTGTGEGG